MPEPMVYNPGSQKPTTPKRQTLIMCNQTKKFGKKSGLSSSPFHCYNCVVRKSKALYPMNVDLCSSFKNQARSKNQNEAIKAQYLIFQRINGKVLSD